MYEEKKNIYIENLFNKPSGDEFWKSLEVLKKTNEIGINKENERIVDENLRDLLIIKADEIVNDPSKIKIVEKEKVKQYEISKRAKLSTSRKE